MCSQCLESSVNSHGVCDVCGFNEAQHVAEYDTWLDNLEAPSVAHWLDYELEQATTLAP